MKIESVAPIKTNNLKTDLDTALKEKMRIYMQNHNGNPYPTWDTLYLNRKGERKDKSWLNKWLKVKKDDDKAHVGFTWNDEDRRTEYWYPQGITGLRSSATLDAEDKYIVVGWYGNAEKGYGYKGARLSFVNVTDMENIVYRHVLLVEPSGDDKIFRAITAGFDDENRVKALHAGGLASQGSIIFVVDTNKGIRAFDTRYMFPAEPNDNPKDSYKNKCGVFYDDPKKPNTGKGKAYAYDYRYILPQSGYYPMKMDNEIQKFSFTSVSWSDNEMKTPLLITGNYHNADKTEFTNPPSVIVKWELNNITTISRYLASINTGVDNVQGGVLIGDLLLLSQSDGKNAKLHVKKVKNEMLIKSTEYEEWPSGCEDLHYSPYSNNLWCLTEFPDGHFDYAKRFVYAVKLVKYPI